MNKKWRDKTEKIKASTPRSCLPRRTGPGEALNCMQIRDEERLARTGWEQHVGRHCDTSLSFLEKEEDGEGRKESRGGLKRDFE